MRDSYLVFGSPLIEEPEIREVVATIRSGWIGTGPKVRAFEDQFREYIGSRHACAVSSCTAALHLSMLASGVGAGDEVITTPLVLAAMALDHRARVITDWGLFCLSAFGVGLAIILGVNLLQNEIGRKTLYVVLSRPLARWRYVAGKFLGELGVLAIEVALIALTLVLMLAFEDQPLGGLLFKAMALYAAEIVMVAAWALFFSSFSSPYLSGFFTLGLFVVGRSLEVLRHLVDKVEITWVHAVLKGFYYLLPDLAVFNRAPRVVNNLPIPWSEMGAALAYAAGYVNILVFLSCWVFSRRELA